MDTLFRIIALIFAIIAVMTIIHVISHEKESHNTYMQSEDAKCWMQCAMPVVVRWYLGYRVVEEKMMQRCLKQ